jgi:hypothetical protein
MHQLRSASSSPESQIGNFSTVSPSNRVLRSSNSSSPTKDRPIFFLNVGKNTRSHKRSWSSFSSDSSSSDHDGELQSAAQKDYAHRKAPARAFQFLTPVTSPQTSFRDNSKSDCAPSPMKFLQFPLEVSWQLSPNPLTRRGSQKLPNHIFPQRRPKRLRARQALLALHYKSAQ